MVRAYDLGNWVSAEGRIYDMFDPKVHMINTQTFLSQLNIHPKAIRWLVGCDYGTSTVMSWGLYARVPNPVSPGTFMYLKVREYYYDAVKKKAQKTDYEFANDFKSGSEKLYLCMYTLTLLQHRGKRS